MKMRKTNKSAGFTLVEVLAALAILGIGILGVTTLFPRALRDAQRASALTNSANYAESEFSRYRAKGFQGLYGKPRRYTDGLTYASVMSAARAYEIYGWGDEPIRLVKSEIVKHFKVILLI